MPKKSLKAVIVGCGAIANAYTDQLKKYSNIEIAGFSDLAPDRAEAFAAKHGGKAYPDFKEVLSDKSIDLIVNLTIHHAHVEVITKCLQAGKHVHTEKPLALTYADAKKLVTLAARKKLRLSSAPSTFLGEAAQTCGALLREGKIGKLRLSYAEMNHGRIETWHPNPAPFFAVGPVWDVAVYPLTIWAAFCGPIRKVRATGRILLPKRKTKEGKPFSVTAPDCVIATIEFASGMLGRLTTNFYVPTSKQTGIEFHGDGGSIHLNNNFLFDTAVEMTAPGEGYKPVPLLREGYKGVEFARGVADLADAIIEKRPHRCNAGMAAHVVEVVQAIHKSATTDKAVAVKSSFTQPAKMPWAP